MSRGVVSVRRLGDEIKFLKYRGKSSTSKFTQPIITYMAWDVWKAHNKFVFNDQNVLAKW